MDKISPERKLCRITNCWRPGLEKFQNEIDKFRMIKLSDPVPRWTLVLENDNEESEKTEESSSDEELFDFNLPKKNIDHEPVVDCETAKLEKPNKTVNEGVTREHNHYNRPNRHRNKNNNRYYGRGRRNNINKTSMNYKGHANREEIYSRGRDYNSGANQSFSLLGNQDFSSESKQERTPASSRDQDILSTYKRGFKHKYNFHSAPRRDNITADRHVNYNAEHYQHSLQHPAAETPPSPWIRPPILLQNYSLPSVSHAIPEKPRSSVGLLGDRPSYAPSHAMFPPNGQNNTYSHNENSTFNPVVSNLQSDAKSDNFLCDHNSFVHNQNPAYSSVTSNFPSNKQTDKFGHDKNYWNNSYGNYSQSNQRRKKRYNNNHQRQNSQDNISRRHANVRNDSSFDYRD